MPSNAALDAAVQRYKLLSELPALTGARFDAAAAKAGESESTVVHLSLSIRSQATLQKRAYRAQLLLGGADGKGTLIGQAQVDSSEKLVAYSTRAGSKVRVVCREAKSAKGEETRRVELWKGTRCVADVDVSKAHGAFVRGEPFASISLSENEDAVLYVASANAPKKRDASAALALSSLGKDDDDDDAFTAYDYTPSLGEKQGPLLRPRIFLLRFNSRSSGRAELSALQLPAEAWGAAEQGQAIFAGDQIACTVYEALHDGRKLGVVYCTNRPSTVLRVPLPSAVAEADDGKKDDAKPGQPREVAWKPEAKRIERVSKEGWSGRSPRWDAAGNGTLYWVENERQGAHNDCSRLLKSEAAGASQTLVDIVDVPESDTAFPGLYLGDLPARFALNDGALAFSSIWGSRRLPLLVTRDGQVHDLAPAQDDCASWGVLATDGERRILATTSSVGRPPRLMLGTLQADKSCKWTELWDSAEDASDTEAIRGLADLSTEVVTVPQTQQVKEDQTAQAVLIRGPSDPRGTRQPCIIFPHGGPHSTTTTDFAPSTAALVLSGFTVVAPNYHGSLGRGQRFARSLLGRCGELDVFDCAAAAQWALERDIASKDSLIAMGGSHGGFLSAHLVGQHPDLFRAAVMRNPVIDVASMAATTDIPDWCFAELGHDFPYAAPPSSVLPQVAAAMHAASPIAHVANIKAPVLLLLGLSDRRVPPQQAKQLFHALRQQGTRTRMLAFPDDDHALDSVEAESVGWEAAFAWMQEALAA